MSSTIGEKPCRDADGHYYKQVKIGNQTWMAENLKTTKYRDGTPIPLVTDSGTWENLSTGAYSYYYNDPDNVNFGGDLNITTLGHAGYGNLYNWYAVDTGKLAPEGWHVSTDNEIKELEISLGMSQEEADNSSYRGTNEGSKLAGNVELWNDGDLVNNSEFGTSGFTAPPGGYRDYEGEYESRADKSYFWSSTMTNSPNVWYRILIKTNSKVFRSFTNWKSGMSMRCVRDN